MRRRIAVLAAGTTSAVILSFVIPLALLVRTMAADRAINAADQEAGNVAILVSGLHNSAQLATFVADIDDRGPAAVTVLMANGQMLGTPVTGLANDPEIVRARTGEAFTVRDARGARVYIPVLTPGADAVVRASLTQEQLEVGVEQAWVIIGALGALMFLVALAAADAVGRRISRPVTQLAGVAHRLRDGELSARADLEGPPEVAELGEALNRLAERIEELLLAERAMVGDLSHRLRTPVTALRLDAEAVAQPEVAERLQDHIVHLQRSIDAIVAEARRPIRTSMPRGCDLAEIVRERVDFWSPLAEDQGRNFTVDVQEGPLRVGLAEADARDILDVLLDNVFAHTPEGTDFALSLHTANDAAVMVVSDHGPGMVGRGQEQPRRVGSTGLGLDIVERTVADQNGDVTVTGPAGGGTTVRVSLPLGDATTAD